MEIQRKYMFLSYSSTSWDGQWTIVQNLLSEFSKSCKVVSISPRKELRHVLRDLFHVSKWKFGLKKINRNLLLIESPPIFPKIYKFKTLDNLIDALYHVFIKIVCRFLQKDCTKVLFIWEPNFSSFRKYYKGCKYIYYPYDLFEKYKYAGKEKNSCALESKRTEEKQNESELVRDAFLLYAVSDLLCEYYNNKFNRCPKLLPNAVSSIYFEADADKLIAEKAKSLIEHIPGARIGYCGSLKGVLNLDIIIDSAKKLSNYSFVFIGKVIYTNIKEYDEKVNVLLSLSNVYTIGPFDMKYLPYLLHQMDILTMIYSDNKDCWTYYGDPLKLFEYMSIGKKIISTPHPVVKKYEKYISIVEDSEQFISAATRIDTSEDPMRNNDMIEIAKNNTWEYRKNTILTDVKMLVESAQI